MPADARVLPVSSDGAGQLLPAHGGGDGAARRARGRTAGGLPAGGQYTGSSQCALGLHRMVYSVHSNLAARRPPPGPCPLCAGEGRVKPACSSSPIWTIRMLETRDTCCHPNMVRLNGVDSILPFFQCQVVQGRFPVNFSMRCVLHM